LRESLVGVGRHVEEDQCDRRSHEQRRERCQRRKRILPRSKPHGNACIFAEQAPPGTAPEWGRSHRRLMGPDPFGVRPCNGSPSGRTSSGKLGDVQRRGNPVRLVVALSLAFALAVYAAVGGGLGAYARRRRLVDSARNALYAAFGATAVAAIVLLNAFRTRDFSFAYVAEHSSKALPFPYVYTAFWGG